MKDLSISQKNEKLIGDAVMSAFQTDFWNVVDRCDRGMTSSVIYKISVNDRFYIARISDPNHPHNNLDREYDSMRVSAGSEVGPTVYYTNAVDGLAIIAFIDMVQLSQKDMCQPLLSKKLGIFIRKLHDGSKFQDETLVFKRLDMLYGMLPLNIKENKLVELAIQTKSKLLECLSDLSDLKPSHADINPYNLLFDGKSFTLVDWATAAQESLYFDLAACARFFYYNDVEAETAFIRAYFNGELSESQSKKYQEMKVFVAIFYGIAFLFLSCVRGKIEISDSDILQLPTYEEFSQLIANGGASLSDSESQKIMGLIFLKMVELEVCDDSH